MCVSVCLGRIALRIQDRASIPFVTPKREPDSCSMRRAVQMRVCDTVSAATRPPELLLESGFFMCVSVCLERIALRIQDRASIA